MNARLVGVLLLAVCLQTTAHAQEIRRPIAGVRVSPSIPRITHRSTELGIGAAFTSVAGSTRGTAELRIGTFAIGPKGIANAELEFGYTRGLEVDVLDLAIALGVLSNPGGGTVYPYLNGIAGIRQEWIGSFKQGRWPVGFALGVRFLTGPHALFRVEYRLRRVFDDPVADYNEQGLMCGISLLIGNGS